MTYDEYLAHYGILGMKWGKRNGPPYPLTSSQMSSAERKSNTPKSSKEMSDEELNKAINRLKKEKEYEQLTSQEVSSGKKWINNFMKSSGNIATSALSVAAGKKIAGLILAGIGFVAAYSLDVVDLWKNGVFD